MIECAYCDEKVIPEELTACVKCGCDLCKDCAEVFDYEDYCPECYELIEAPEA